MLSFKSISYEEMRLEYFRKQRDAAERRMNYWCGAKQADRVGWMEASDRASEAGAQYNFYNDALEALEAAKDIKVPTAQPKWISVEERLPDDLEEVLILVKETEFYGQYKEFSKSYFCQYIGCVDDGEWFTVWCHGHRYIKDTAKEPYADKFEVTHWMPLPEAPKEEA